MRAARADRRPRRRAPGGPGWRWPPRCPTRTCALVESAIRHCRYLERAIEAAGLANAEVVHARAEAWPDGLGALRSRDRPGAGRAAGAVRVRGAAARRGRRARGWKGAVARGGGRRPRARPRSSGCEPAAPCAGHAVPGRARPHAARVLQDRAHAGRASRAGPGWRANARSALTTRQDRASFHVKRAPGADPPSRR